MARRSGGAWFTMIEAMIVLLVIAEFVTDTAIYSESIPNV